MITPVAILALAARPTNPALNAFPGHLLKLAPAITWPLLVSLKESKKQVDRQNTRAQTHTYGQSELGVGSAKLARGFVRKSTNAKVRSEIVRLFGDCSELARSPFGVCPEFARSLFGVRSEFVRSPFGVRSEFVRSWFTCGHNDLLQVTVFFANTCNCQPRI